MGQDGRINNFDLKNIQMPEEELVAFKKNTENTIAAAPQLTNQPNGTEETQTDTHVSVVSISPSINQSMFLHLDALICSFLTIQQHWQGHKGDSDTHL